MSKEANKIRKEDLPIHAWYRFVLAYPPHLVRHYIEKFSLGPGSVVLDPFCGTGTTLVECLKHGISTIGVEGNPMAHFASVVKTSWNIEPEHLVHHAGSIAQDALDTLRASGIQDEECDENHQASPLKSFSEEEEKVLLKNSISPLPLHKTLILREKINEHASDEMSKYERLALAKVAVEAASNLRFGPEVGVGKIKKDAEVISPWLRQIEVMAHDLSTVPHVPGVTSIVHLGDARNIEEYLEPCSVDAVITSPPYPNEKDYSRATRLESVLLGFVTSRDDLRKIKKQLVRSNTRGIYKEDNDADWVKDDPVVQKLADEIEQKRVDLGKTSGFERSYHKVVRHYFGGMAKHLTGLRMALKPGARLAYVVGDQASFFQTLIRTGEILAHVAEKLGYRVDGIDLFRTRFSTTTKSELREEVVLLSWHHSSVR